MPDPNSPQSFSEARKEFKKLKKKQKKKQKKQTQETHKTKKARRHRRSKLSQKIAKASKKKKRKTKKAKGKIAKGKIAKTIRCDCGDKSYTGSELTPRGLGHCEECTLENVILRGADGKLYRNTGDQDHRQWVKVLRN